MSREVHNGPTDETQARGTPYQRRSAGRRGPQPQQLDKLPLDSWHRARGARMVPFAGYEMPVQYEGIIAEHLWTRENAGLFDVSHMGQLLVHGRGVDVALEKLMPGDFQAAADMKPKYSLLLDDEGGIVDDLMATRRGDDFYIVVNGATKHGDIADMRARLPGGRRHRPYEAAGAARAPRAARCRGARNDRPRRQPNSPSCRRGPFNWQGRNLWISRSGYTGEDGFEISVPAVAAADLADAIAAHELVKPIGLGARDSLRLEAGLPLYGHDIDHRTTPVMAGLDLRHQQAPPRRRRVCRRHADSGRARRTARPKSASGSRSTAGSRCAKARSSSMAKAMKWARLPAAAFRLRCSGRSPWAMSPPSCRAGHRAEARAARQIVRRARRADAVRPSPLSPQGSRLMSLYFTKEHEWIRVDGDTATVGISDHAQEQLGDIVFAEVPETGKRAEQGPGSSGRRIGEGRVGRLFAGLGRSDRGQQQGRRRSFDREQRSRRARAGSSSSSSTTRASSTG